MTTSTDTDIRPVAEIARERRSMRDGHDGHSLHPRTIVGWMTRGKVLSDGSVKKCRGQRYPSGWVTSHAAIDEFIGAITRDATGEPAAAPVEAAKPSRGHQRAEAELAAAGL